MVISTPVSLEEYPLVSVICLCYNHQDFVIQSIQSVLDQDYPNIEIIIVDDASTDGSKEAIERFLTDKPDITFIPLIENLGNCAAFNIGYRKSKGQYIIDLATDDKLINSRVTKQVEAFESLDATYGVVYSDAQIIDAAGSPLYRHTSRFPVFQDDVYEYLISTYFVSPPTMMVKREVFDLLDGYDERLAYEDFDFWIRSSRYFKYHFLNEMLTEVRRVKGSKSANYDDRQKAYTLSTVRICEKIKEQNKTASENRALSERLRYELKHAAVRGLRDESQQFFTLLSRLNSTTFRDRFLLRLSKVRLNLWPLIRRMRSH